MPGGFRGARRAAHRERSAERPNEAEAGNLILRGEACQGREKIAV